MESTKMRIVVFGAGALGTLYAVRLALAGHDVALVARGARLAALRAHPPTIRRRGAPAAESADIRIVERVAEVAHDLIIVLVRRHHLDAVLPRLAHDGDQDASDVLSMINLADGYGRLESALGARLLVGFAGAAASFAPDGTLEYQIEPSILQPTVLGEPHGAPTPRVARVARALTDAGFPTRMRDDMEEWQRSHAAWITPFMLATAAVGQHPSRFIDPVRVRLWMDATKETLAFVRASRGRLSPRGLGLVSRIPASWLALLARIAFAPRMVRDNVVATGLDSRAEGLALAAELQSLADDARSALPHLARLHRDARG